MSSKETTRTGSSHPRMDGNRTELPAKSADCTEVREHWADVLEGTANDSLYDHLASCDDCRDARHDAERAAELVAAAGQDYVFSADFEERVLRAVSEVRGTASEAADPGAVAESGDGGSGVAAESESAGSSSSSWGDEDEGDVPEVASSAPVAGLKRRRGLVWGAVVLAAAAGATLLVRPKEGGELSLRQATSWQGEVAQIRTAGDAGGVEICSREGAECQLAAVGQQVPPGAVVRTTDASRVRLVLDEGSELVLDRSTELVLASGGREAKLRRGTLVAEVASRKDDPARFELPVGHVEVLGTKLSLRASEESASVEVSRGQVRLVDSEGRGVLVHAGEEGWLNREGPPEAGQAPHLAESMSWSETFLEEEGAEQARGLGQLVAKKPGTDRELDGAVTLTSHKVSVRISGVMARTEVEEVFTNHTGDVLEGIYRFPIPPDAKIERLALEVDGRLEEGAFVDRDRAASIWRGAIVNSAPKSKPAVRDEVIWVPGPWKDPALLEWQRGGRFELRVFPIPARGARRVVLAYTQVIAPSGNLRRYTYPLAHDTSGSTRVDRFEVDVQVRGHDTARGVRSRGYALSQGSQGSTVNAGAESLSLTANQFVPSGDLVLEYALPGPPSELTAWSYQGEGPTDDGEGSAPYVAFALRPELPRVATRGQRAYALVVDASRSMFGEGYRRALRLVGRVIRELDPGDQVTILACDTTCRHLPGGFRAAGTGAAVEAERFLEGIDPEGASDVTAAVMDAGRLVSQVEGRELRIVYLGDGTPTVGPLRPGTVARAVAQAVPPSRATLTAVAVGADSDIETLGALARGGGGVVVPYSPGQSLAEAAYAVLGATYGHALRDVHVTLPQGLRGVLPRQLDTLLAGGEALVFARMDGHEVEGDVVVRGRVGETRFERSYPVRISASQAAGNAFVPRLYAAARIAELEQEGDAQSKQMAVALSGRYSVASRYTSLLVLESPAMFRAFGLDNSRKAPTWSGEEEAEGIALGPLDDGWGSRLGGSHSASSGVSAPRARAAASKSSTAPNWDGTSRPGSFARPMVPMRRIWERIGSVQPERTVPAAANSQSLSEAQREFEANPHRREAVKRLYVLYSLAGELERANDLAQRWSEKEPLDPEALTARADLAARRGDRELSLRLLGSVLDVRPDDLKSQKRLARAYLWAGDAPQACRYSIALAEAAGQDAELLEQAVHCTRELGQGWLAEHLLRAADEKTRLAAEARLTRARPDPFLLAGDVRIEGNWSGGVDLDLALLTPDGHRVSWLGAPTRAIITARDVTSPSMEGLALNGAGPGEYVIEVVRASGSGPASGTLQVTAGATKRQVPFHLDGERVTVAVMKISMRSRLVPM